MINRILVGVADPAYSISAAHHAIGLAKVCDAGITAVSVLDFDRLRKNVAVVVGTGVVEKETRSRFAAAEEAITVSIDAIARLCSDARVDCNIVRESGDPFSRMIDVSRYHDLMVFGLRGLFEHGVIDEPVDELARLISSGVRPILAVGREHREITRVLVAYSGSIESAKTMRRFTQLRTLWPEALVRIVHFGSRRDGPVLLTDAREYMKTHGIEPEIEVVDGSPRKHLLEYADKWQADMIVLGNSAKNLLRRRVLGETALHAIRESTLPLFLSQ